MIDYSAPLAGISAAQSSLNQSAANIAKSGFPGGGDSVDLSSEMVALLQARNSVQTDVNVVRTEDQMTRSLLNLVG